MIQRSRTALAAFALLSLTATPAWAQDPSDGVGKTVFDGDFLIVGAAGTYSPTYEGSDDYNFSALPVVIGRIGGVGISPRPGGIALDFINDPSDAKISFQAGPTARIRFERHGKTKDDVVERLGRRKTAWEVGGNVGLSINRITNPYDSLTFSVDVRHDVGNAHKGTIVAPNISFLTPLSKGSLIAINASAERVDGKYARYYYTVTPADSVASGLPVYGAQSGWKNATIGMLGTFDLDGDLTDGGFSVFAGGSYSRLLGDFRRAPVVDLRGSPNQWTGAVGIAYIF